MALQEFVKRIREENKEGFFGWNRATENFENWNWKNKKAKTTTEQGAVQ